MKCAKIAAHRFSFVTANKIGPHFVNKSIRVPVLPNRPLSSQDEKQQFGEVLLRTNVQLGFTENALFDGAIVEYDENYQNSVAHSAVFQKHMKDVADLIKNVLPRGSRLVEVGCGKGHFLDLLAREDYFILSGYDATYEGDNPNIHRRYLTTNDKIDSDFIVLRHVLEHIPNPYKFLDMLKSVFGICPIYIEVPDFDWIKETGTFVDITYEHVNYFTKKSLSKLFGDQTTAIGNLFGGQYMYVIADINDLSPSFLESYELDSGWESIDFDSLFPSLLDKIEAIEQVSGNQNVYVWGGATKGCMFVYHCLRLGKLSSRIRFAVDTNPAKWHKYVPGTAIQIEPPDSLFQEIQNNDVVVITNPNYRDEILKDLHDHGIFDVQVFVL